MSPKKTGLALAALALSFAVPMIVPAAAFAAESVPAKLQVSDQKSAITILQPGPYPLYDLFTKRFVDQGRFDYYPISYRNDDKPMSVTELTEKFQKYLKDNATAIASKGKKPDFKFGDVSLSGEQLDRMLSSAYVMAPRWSYGQPVVSEEKSVTDKDGVETITVEVSAPLKLVNEVINVQTGAVLGRQEFSQKVSKELKLRIPPKSSERDVKRWTQDFQAEKAQARRLTEYRSEADVQIACFKYFDKDASIAASTVMSFVMANVRKMDAFVLKSKITENNGSLKMLLGSEMGVVHDSVFNVYRRQNGEMVNVGFLKVRDMDDKTSAFQGIRDTGFEPDDQLVEHPQTGYDGGIKLGFATFDPKGGSALAPSLMFGGETNLAQMFKSSLLSETYVTADANFILPMQEDFSKLVVGGQGLLGIKKRFYVNQFALSLGLKGGLTASSGTVAETRNTSNNAGESISDGSNIDVIGVGFGAGPALGLEFQANPDLRFGFDVGYLLSTNVNPYKVSVKDRVSEKVSEFDVSQLRSDLLPNAISASGLTFALTGTYSF